MKIKNKEIIVHTVLQEQLNESETSPAVQEARRGASAA
jgi:hypothetical protein